MDNYYTPEIEEFCVGFEYEVLEDSRYVKRIFSVDDSSPYSFDDVDDLIKISRVKSLDRSDLDDLDFSSCVLGPFIFVYNKKVQLLDHLEDVDIFISYSFVNDHVLIFSKPTDGASVNTLFVGNIRNRFELKRVLYMINVLKK